MVESSCENGISQPFLVAKAWCTSVSAINDLWVQQVTKPESLSETFLQLHRSKKVEVQDPQVGPGGATIFLNI